jgi:hypothetical protein
MRISFHGLPGQWHALVEIMKQGESLDSKRRTRSAELHPVRDSLELCFKPVIASPLIDLGAFSFDDPEFADAEPEMFCTTMGGNPAAHRKPLHP